ncbi:hypothetical protein VOLCADRAFT_105499 [Volvox carteri f. nagariensis]|uniref:Expansin-like EG45 domain-containing protein n=1 Tax=Volvox carteri f. nagariensis TaxID=3068 RepID=D8U189_VOLCA|nr:uncharacterized protein VOLCADRAFT_105499 [Volvox carteri f. nagariensis]EFJ46592.1 hypothetical protein VOLCADRAFT_105499 [Volvox carteri f. nagariensis]|eukprot:XP_002952449.1 hypothetical protein VOLCADRAFT_105499 [Volvox carteri f. nagariensis]
MQCNLVVVGAALLLATLTFCAADLPLDPLPLSDWTNGSSIFWGGPQDGQDDPFSMRLPPGACGYGEQDPKMWPFFGVTGVSPQSPLVRDRPQASCGTCLEVKCASPDPQVCTSTASVTVVITDVCPDCAANELNLHALAFQQIARLEYGSAAIQYRQVECSPMDNIAVYVDGFRVVQGGWLRLSLKSVASDGAAVLVELARSPNATGGSNATSSTVALAGGNKTTVINPAPQPTADLGAPKADGADNASTILNATWKPMTNTYGAEWELSALPGPPYDLRLTDRYGRKIVLSNVITRAGALGEFPGRAQFPGLNATSSSSSSKAASPVQVPVALAGNGAAIAPTPSTPKPTPTPTTAPSGTVPTLRSSILKSVDRRRLLGTASQPASGDTIRQVSRRQMRQRTRGQKAGPLP